MAALLIRVLWLPIWGVIFASHTRDILASVQDRQDSLLKGALTQNDDAPAPALDPTSQSSLALEVHINVSPGPAELVQLGGEGAAIAKLRPLALGRAQGRRTRRCR